MRYRAEIKLVVVSLQQLQLASLLLLVILGWSQLRQSVGTAHINTQLYTHTQSERNGRLATFAILRFISDRWRLTICACQRSKYHWLLHLTRH